MAPQGPSPTQHLSVGNEWCWPESSQDLPQNLLFSPSILDPEIDSVVHQGGCCQSIRLWEGWSAKLHRVQFWEQALVQPGEVHMLQNDKSCLFSQCQTMPFSCICTIGIKFPLRGSLVFIHMVSLPLVSHQFSLINLWSTRAGWLHLLGSQHTNTSCPMAWQFLGVEFKQMDIDVSSKSLLSL